MHDCRMRLGTRFPQWWVLFVAILVLLSGEGSLVVMEHFAKGNLEILNQLLATVRGKAL